MKTKNFKVINNYEDCFNYVNLLGFAGNGTIQHKQMSLNAIAQKLCDVSGNNTWFNKEFKPFKVKFNRFYSESGFYFPYLGSFVIEHVYTYELNVYYPEKNSTYKYIKNNNLCSGHGSVNDPYHKCYVCSPSK